MLDWNVGNDVLMGRNNGKGRVIEVNDVALFHKIRNTNEVFGFNLGIAGYILVLILVDIVHELILALERNLDDF